MHPENFSFMQFSQNIDGFRQNNSQGFIELTQLYKQNPLEKIFIFTIYQNYTLALSKMTSKLYFVNYCHLIFHYTTL